MILPSWCHGSPCLLHSLRLSGRSRGPFTDWKLADEARERKEADTREEGRREQELGVLGQQVRVAQEELGVL